MDAIRRMLEWSRDENRGLLVHLSGGALALVVREIDGDTVIGHSRDHERIVVRLDRIEAVAT